MRRSYGFTLVELLVSTIVLSILGVIVTTSFSQLGAVTENLRRERASEENRKIGRAFQDIASSLTKGRLPTPYTGSGYTSAPINLSPTAADTSGQQMLQNMQQTGLGLERINSDGYASQRVKVYQTISLVDDVPFFGSVGETVQITYDYGVVYQTSCPLNDATCNPTPATGIPGDSEVLTSSNYKTWVVKGEDLRPYFFSTYALQRSLVSDTKSRVLSVRNSLSSYFASQVLAAAPGTTTNFFPTPKGAGAPDMSGSNPLTNDGCRNGWYNLDAANVDVLAQLNLLPTSFYGRTAFGGVIQYCADFDPANTSADTQPHGAALRFSKSITSGAIPATGSSFVISL